MNKLHALLVAILVHNTSMGQIRPLDIMPTEKDERVFSKWYNIGQGAKELNTVGLGPWLVNDKKEVPPLFEGQIRQDFLLMRGRYDQRPWKRALAINFNLGLNLRMYQGDLYSSYPVLPINFMVPGLSVDYFLNHIPSFFGRPMPDDKEIKNYFTLRIQVSHFSNGQSSNFYNFDSSSSNKIDGNFSTNFVRTDVSWSRYFNDNLLTAKMHYRRDFGIGDLLGMEEGLYHSYGRDRVGFFLQLRTKDAKIGHYTYRRAKYRACNEPGKYVLHTFKGRVRRYATWLFRAETEYIFGDMSNYPTFKNPSQEKLRGNFKFTVAYYPSNMRTLGLFAQVYYGRDYYNIRYTDKLMNIKAGFVFDLHSYIPPNRFDLYMKPIDLEKLKLIKDKCNETASHNSNN